jgi:hypothetical protein
MYSALSAQLNTLVQIYQMPESERNRVWAVIAAAPGGPKNVSIERAIAIQIGYLDDLAMGKDIKNIRTYGASGS